ncbi:MAG: hypothetical protein U0Q21_02525 [Dermatophilaceae bacterium]
MTRPHTESPPAHAWPPGRPGRVPLFSPRVVVNLGLLSAGVAALTWYSFAPAPDYVLLVTIIVVGWTLLWIAANLRTAAHEQTWQPYRPLAGRRRGRDSRVSQLRSLVQESSDPARADALHDVIDAVTRDRLAARGVDPAGREELLALCGPDLLTYLDAPPGARRRHVRDLDQYLARIERI